MRNIKVCVASTPIGFDKDINATKDSIVTTWTNSGHGKWCKEHAENITIVLNEYTDEMTWKFDIFAEFTHENNIKHKLIWANEKT